MEFVAALRHVAFFVDPQIEIKVELESGTEGSLSLNSILKAIKDASDQPITLKALLICALVWFGLEIASHEVQKELDRLEGADAVKISDEDANKIADLVAKMLANRDANVHVRQVYRELQEDPHIKGVGATTNTGQRPEKLVPRSEFAFRSEEPNQSEAGATRREKATEETLILIKPVLLNKSSRRWRFSYRGHEFSAAIHDKDFLEKVDQGKLPVPLRSGIELTVDLQVTQEFKDNVWETSESVVLKVKSIKEPAAQVDLFSAPEQSDHAKD